MKSALLTFSLAAIAFTQNSQAAWQRLGGVEKHPIDIASSSLAGTKITSFKGVGQPENLISDDVTASSKVSPGQSEVVISLGRQLMVDYISLINDGAEGRVSVEGSIDNHKWAPLSQQVFTSSDRSITLCFAGAGAAYVKLAFDLSKAGAVKSLGIYGSIGDKDIKGTDLVGSDPETSDAVDVAGGLGGGRVIYINPTPVEGDEAVSKYGRFSFPESPDKFRTVIFDFGRARTITQIGSVHSPRPVRLYAYAFENDLPEKEDWRGRKSFDPIVFDNLSPVATVEDARGVGYIKSKLSKSVRARYMALRWEPDFNPPEFGVFFVSMISNGLPRNDNNFPGGGGGASGGGSGNNNPNDPQGQFNGTPFSNPFSFSTGGYGSPGRGSNTNPGTPRGPFDPFASP